MAHSVNANAHATRKPQRWLIAGVLAGVVLTGFLVRGGHGQPLTGAPDSVAHDGHGRILHRFLAGAANGAPTATRADAGGSMIGASPGGGRGQGTAKAAATPTFVYDPRKGSGAAEPEVRRGDDAPPAPVLTDAGLRRPGMGDGAEPPPPATAASVEPALPTEPSPTGAAAEPEPTSADTGTPTATNTPGEAPPTANPAPAESAEAATENNATETNRPESPAGDAPAPEAAPDDVKLRFGDRVRPDTETEKESNLEYYEVFNPSIVPHKRGRVLNAVDATFDVVLDRGSLRPVSLGTMSHTIAAGRDTFAAEAIVESNGRDPVPLPSVSADDAILGWEAVPPQDVRFFRDAADNLYARLPVAGRARLTWRLAAPRSYFARRLDSLGRMGPGALPAAVRPDPPAVVKAQAREVARGIGLSPTASLASMLDHLVYHFRGFTPGEPPLARAGIYRDLALGRVGVCRHRAFAFVVTAQGLGIPARYVYNEAHVFVEVWLPASDDAPAGWTRIDLGGGAETLDVHGGHDKTLHRPPPDSFATPPGFNSDALAGATEVRGLPPAQAEPEVSGSSADTIADGTGGAAASAQGENATETGAAPVAEPAAGPNPNDSPFRWPASILSDATTTPRNRVTDAMPADLRAATTVAVTVAARDVVRGVPFQVEGFVRDETGAPVKDGFVQILLEPPAFSGRARAAPWLLGVARLDAQGRYAASVVIPPGLNPGAYEVVVEFPGTTTHRAGLGR